MSDAAPITLVLVAGHHNTPNIAAQRYRGLLNHLDPARVRCVVITREGALRSQPPSVVETIVVPGVAFTARESGRYLAALTLKALAPALPLARAIAPDSWGLRAAIVARDVVFRERAAGHRCVVLGSFCPLDAVVAAAAAARDCGVPLALDFRDGLGFESFGRQDRMGMAVKRRIERALCRQSDAVLSVSEPLVSYFKGRFPHARVELLPNGFDPQEADYREPHIEACVDRYVRRLRVSGACVIGHFGRLSRSDPGCLPALEELARSVNAADPAIRQRLHLLFMGELGPADRRVIASMRCRVSVLRARPKPWALSLMRSCDGVLLLTSERTSVATGKFFDYLCCGTKVLHISLTRNEAARLLEHTGMAHVGVDTRTGTMSDEDWRAFMALEANPNVARAEYSRAEQAVDFERLLRELGRDG